MISADRTTVTFRPDAGLKSIKHPFWKPTKHDGTRLYIYGSDLSSLKTGEYSLKAHVACGTDISDLSCLADPTVPEGLSLVPEAAAVDCPDPDSPTTPQTTTAPPQPPTEPPTAPPQPGTDDDVVTDPPIVTQAPPTTTCNYIGTHNGGNNPNSWQSGNSFEYQAYINIPIRRVFNLMFPSQSLIGRYF